MTILIAPRWQPQMHERVRPSPFWLQLVHLWVGTSVPFSLVLLLSSWDFLALQAINTADQRQVHHLLERGKHWLWEQLCSESKTIQQILRRGSDFHREVRDLPINDLFLVITSRVRGEFLAGFLKNHRGQPAHFTKELYQLLNFFFDPRLINSVHYTVVMANFRTQSQHRTLPHLGPTSWIHST